MLKIQFLIIISFVDTNSILLYININLLNKYGLRIILHTDIFSPIPKKQPNINALSIIKKIYNYELTGIILNFKNFHMNRLSS